MSELPDNVKRFDILKVEYARKKLCQCREPHYEIDYRNRLVYCTDCGAIVDPFDVLNYLATHYNRISSQVEGLLEQRKEILNWKPWLLSFRKLESEYRGGKMLPCCPVCNEPFYFERIVSWVDRKMVELRVEKLEGEKG
jgi:hypothetical protein